MLSFGPFITLEFFTSHFRTLRRGECFKYPSNFPNKRWTPNSQGLFEHRHYSAETAVAHKTYNPPQRKLPG